MYRLIPWWLLHFIDRHSDYCWTAMVMWKLGYEWHWKNDCGFEDDGRCYCGKVWPDRPRMRVDPPLEGV